MLEKLNDVPEKPGVYMWKDVHGNVIYVGKANNLQNRMKQYFRGMLNSYKTSKLVELIDSFDFIITHNSKEALILERNLIEKYNPKFNILLIDNKRYPYISVSLKKILEIKLEYRIRSKQKDGTIYYGPFPTGYGARRIVDLLNRMTIYKNGLPSKETSEEYWQKEFDYIKGILNNKTKSLTSILKEKMFEAAEKEQYEIAKDLKETIMALSHFNDEQSVELAVDKNIDVISFYEYNQYLSISMFFYRHGLMLSKNEFVLEKTSNLEETASQFISQFYANNLLPDIALSNIEVESDLLEIQVPQKGTYRSVVDLATINAKNNIELKIASFVRQEELTVGALVKLKNLLGLEKLDHILMVDNSNTNNTLPVSVFVSYRNGVKQPKEYRKYSLNVINDRKADVEYMRQSVTRYFNSENNAIPDLLIVDGGKPQINEVKRIVNIPVIGLVKDDNHMTDHMIDLNMNEIKIEDQLLFNFLKGIQIEVDRYAKVHHANKRMSTLEGFLSKVDGVGPSTEKKLLQHFGTYSKIYNATEEELSKVVSKKVASSIKEALGEK